MQADWDESNQKSQRYQAQIFQDEQQEQYESFDSDEPIGQVEENTDQMVNNSSLSHNKAQKYTLHLRHKQRQIAFPKIPPHLPKLYQIYLHNENRKKQLKSAINDLVQKQLKAIRVRYDQQTSAIQQFIDIEEISEEYRVSKQNYEDRLVKMKNFRNDYERLKIKQIQAILQKTQDMKQILEKFCAQNRQIIAYTVIKSEVKVLCREKKTGQKGARNPMPSKKQVKSQKQGQQISNRASKTSSQDQVLYKYTVRTFKFYECETNQQQKHQQKQQPPKIAFYPMSKCIELSKIEKQNSQTIEFIGLAYEPTFLFTIVYDNHSLYFLKGQKMINTIYIGEQLIIYAKTLNNKLYVGTNDGIIRIYQLDENCRISLEKVVACFYQEYCPVSHFSLTKSEDIVLFVEKQTKLCIMNLTTFTSYLLAELPHKITKISERLLVTEKQVYTYFYNFTGPQVKANLIPSSQLQKYHETIIQITEHQEKSYFITNQDNGNFTVQRLKQNK